MGERRLRLWKWPPPSRVWVEDPGAGCKRLFEVMRARLAVGRDGNDQEYLYLPPFVGEINEDVDSTIEVNGEPLRLLLKDHFGLSHDDLVSMYPSLGGRKRRTEPKKQKRAKDLMREFWGEVGPSEDVTDDMVHLEFRARKIKKRRVSVDTIARARGIGLSSSAHSGNRQRAADRRLLDLRFEKRSARLLRRRRLFMSPNVQHIK